jgi:GNAT superfamily N-acetyltransferase
MSSTHSLNPITYEPNLSPTDGFLQQIQLTENKTPIGSARWHSALNSTDGVAQILDFQIEPTHQRHGHGKRLLAALIEQVVAYHQLRQIPLRRIWLGLNHRKHVNARAFLMSQGFTHTATVKELLRSDDDMLIYIRTFD